MIMNIRALATLSLLAVPAYVIAADDAEQFNAQDYVNEEIEIATSAVDILEKITEENVDKMGVLADELNKRVRELNGKYWKNSKEIIEAQRDKKNQERYYEILDRYEEAIEKAWQLQQNAKKPELEDVVDKVSGVCDALLPRRTAPIGAPAK